MPILHAHGVLLDIEGTTSSIRYVYDVLFPFARSSLRDFLSRRWNDAAVRRARELIAKDAGDASHSGWTEDKVAAEVLRLMDGDIKATGLKELQGLIWDEGYSAGRLSSHVYDDVPSALKGWAEHGKDIRIYSSGSIGAQKVFFKYTAAGDLTKFLRGHYDTTTGPKREAASYARIAADMQLLPNDVLFCSDVVAELDAARAAGMQTVLTLRPGNAPQPVGHGHAEVQSFGAIEMA